MFEFPKLTFAKYMTGIDAIPGLNNPVNNLTTSGIT